MPGKDGSVGFAVWLIELIDIGQDPKICAEPYWPLVYENDLKIILGNTFTGLLLLEVRCKNMIEE